jgi:hypothetical protein
MQADEAPPFPGLQAVGEVGVAATRPNAAATRREAPAESAAKSIATAIAGNVVGVSQASACCGPKFNAVESVVLARPSATAPSTSASRRKPGRVTV